MGVPTLDAAISSGDSFSIKAAAKADAEAAKAALLERLGITVDEAKLLLS